MSDLNTSLHDAAALAIEMANRPILVVEDSLDDRVLLKKHLKTLFGPDSKVVMFQHGGELLDYLEREKKAVLESRNKRRPWLVLLDLHMPGIGGLETLEHLQARKNAGDILLIVVSATQDQAEIDRAYRHGAHACLSKPFSRCDFLETLHLQKHSP